VTYTYDDMRCLDAVLAGEREGYVYSRFANPTVTALEHAIARLEGTEAALGCASGMSAVHLALLGAGTRAGSTVIAAQDLYGGTRALLAQHLTSQAVRVVTADLTDLTAAAQALEQIRPVAVVAETVSNPLLRVTDIPALAGLSHGVGAELIVDNTFATPCLLRPALHGADYVVHSATKYLSGHGDVTAGVIASNQPRCQRARELQRLVGNILGPNEAWLVLRGLKTLIVRMRQQCRNAGQVARFLSSHDRVERLFYPGLPSHPQYTLCRRLFPTGLAGALVSFQLRAADQEIVFRFMDALRLIVPATSLGDVTSLLLYPAHSSHRPLTDDERLQVGVTANLVRLSVGIEEASDIIADLAQALDCEQVWPAGVDEPTVGTKGPRRGKNATVRRDSIRSA
jgi:cystathionine gamma-synthase/methionine-gamma-lyase